MPSSTHKQHNFMEAVAHGWQPSGRHVDIGVAKDFVAADKHAGYQRGGFVRSDIVPQRLPAFMRKNYG